MSNNRKSLFGDHEADSNVVNTLLQEQRKQLFETFKKAADEYYAKANIIYKQLSDELASEKKRLEGNLKYHNNYEKLRDIDTRIQAAKKRLNGKDFATPVRCKIPTSSEVVQKQCERYLEQSLKNINQYFGDLSKSAQRFLSFKLDNDSFIPEMDISDVHPSANNNKQKDDDDYWGFDEFKQQREKQKHTALFGDDSSDDDDFSWDDDEDEDQFLDELDIRSDKDIIPPARPIEPSQELSDYKKLNERLGYHIALAKYLLIRTERMLTEKRLPTLEDKLACSIKSLDSELYDYKLALMTAIANETDAHKKAVLEKRLAGTNVGIEYLEKAEGHLATVKHRNGNDEVRAVYTSAPPSERYFSDNPASCVAEIIPEGVSQQDVNQRLQQYFGRPVGEALTLIAGPTTNTTSANFTRRFIKNEVIINPPKTRLLRSTPAVVQKVGIIEEVDTDRSYSTQTVHTHLPTLDKASDEALFKFVSELVRTGLASVPTGPCSINDKWPPRVGGAIVAYCQFKGFKCSGYSNPEIDKYAEKFSKTMVKHWQRQHPRDVGVKTVKALTELTESDSLTVTRPIFNRG